MAAPMAITDLAGYQHAAYAKSLNEFGSPQLLARSGGWLLVRPIDQHNGRDAMGCYPLFSCRDWSGLSADLDDVGHELVSVSLVLDPFCNFDVDVLRQNFTDRFVPFKTHFVADLQCSSREIVSEHHRYYARRALLALDIELVERPGDIIDEWMCLYAELIARHRIKGLRAFSRAAFAQQLATPGIAVLRARHNGDTVAAHLWYLQDDVGYSHLAAANSVGYRLMASYALYWSALETFRGQIRWLNWGGGAGTNVAAADGLTRFKKGWATGTRTAFFCGRIFDRKRYEALAVDKSSKDDGYFPAYRAGEFI